MQSDEGLVEEGTAPIEGGSEKEPLVADLALVASAQRVEHYEIAGYGNVRTLARLLGETDVAQLLTHTLGEEEAADHLLTMISAPILQEAVLGDGYALAKKTGNVKHETKFAHCLVLLCYKLLSRLG